MSDKIELRAEVPSELGGQRLDQVAAQLFAEHSRSRLSAWIKDGRLTVDGAVIRPRDTVHGGCILELTAEQEAQGEWIAEDIPLDIVYEDDDILVINKPAGLVVHPAAGHASGTVLNALLHHVPDIINVPRAGIVHRLDKDTTGLMVVAKTIQAQTQLVTQLQSRSVSRIYECIVIGVVTAGGKIDAPIGRHGQQRQRMAVMEGGKQAVSHYRVLERFRSHTHVRVKLETGRTHQIRIHALAGLGFPLLGDPIYGDGSGARRTMLHAAAITIKRVGKDPISAIAPLPIDFDALGFHVPGFEREELEPFAAPITTADPDPTTSAHPEPVEGPAQPSPETEDE